MSELTVSHEGKLNVSSTKNETVTGGVTTLPPYMYWHPSVQDKKRIVAVVPNPVPSKPAYRKSISISTRALREVIEEAESWQRELAADLHPEWPVVRRHRSSLSLAYQLPSGVSITSYSERGKHVQKVIVKWREDETYCMTEEGTGSSRRARARTRTFKVGTNRSLDAAVSAAIEFLAEM